MAHVSPLSDKGLKHEIDLELEWRPTIKAERIGVAVTDGAVTLSGQVETYPEKQAALHAVMHVHGVVAVADELRVHHEWGVPDDADIARECEAAFARTAVLTAGSVKGAVHDHIVTLSGTVDWQYQREAARHAVADLPGVSEVRNTIALTSRAIVSPSEAKSKITAALVRHAQIDAQDVHVAVNGNEVILTGTVSNLVERREAEHAAWFAPGVASVENLLCVKP